MENLLPLFLTFISGLFIALGALIVYVTKNNDKFVHFSISMAFGVISTLLVFELFPHSIETLEQCFDSSISYIVFFVCAVIGILLLKILDKFVPDHEQHGNTKKAELDNLYHVGIVSSVALILHNIIEGMSIYGVSYTSLEMGMLMTLGVGCHNIPMGIMITSMFNRVTHKKNSKFIIVLLSVSLSTLIGGLMMMVLSSFISDLFIGILLGITFGMLLYILIFELLHEITEYNNKKLSVVGIIVGVLIFMLSMTIHHH